MCWNIMELIVRLRNVVSFSFAGSIIFSREKCANVLGYVKISIYIPMWYTSFISYANVLSSATASFPRSRSDNFKTTHSLLPMKTLQISWLIFHSHFYKRKNFPLKSKSYETRRLHRTNFIRHWLAWSIINSFRDLLENYCLFLPTKCIQFM